MRTVAAVVTEIVLLVLVSVGALLVRQSQRKWARLNAAREARSNLKGVYQALRWFHADTGRYPEDFSAMGMLPERGNKLVYVYGGGPVQRRETARLASGSWGVIGADQYKNPDVDTDALLAKVPNVLPSGVAPGVDALGAVVIALGDPDLDGVPLIMSIATFDRTSAKAGVPFVEQED
ncbi:MAG: hypothetical protein ACO1OB_28520 [Archangium sp.]